jgi:tRNA modification GTPase
VERVVARLSAIEGVRAAGPGEFTARAYLNDKLTLDQAEGIAATIAAESEEQLSAARGLAEGRTGDVYRAWAEELATLLALVEAGIDFSDQEDVVPISPADLARRLDMVARQLEGHLGAAAGREHADALPRVVLAGSANAGKSTLFNALLGRRRAVVSDVAGTTRDVLEEELDLSRDRGGAGRVMLVDVAGLDAAAGGLIEESAQLAAQRAIESADVILHCDPTARFAVGGKGWRASTVRVRTKSDLPGASDENAIRVCALDGRIWRR